MPVAVLRVPTGSRTLTLNNGDSSMEIYTIYCATNKVNGKKYIGFDSNWPKRLKEHLRQTKYLERAFNRALRKYGSENFSWEIIYQSLDKAHTLNEMETYFIKQYKSHSTEWGYNMTYGGEGTSGYKRPDLTKYNKSLKGKKKNPYLHIINKTKIICENCSMPASRGNYTRWHGINCRKKSITE